MKHFFSFLNLIFILYWGIVDLLKCIFFNYLFLAVLGLRCCTRAFSSCSEWGLVFVVVRRLLIAVASLIAVHGL